MNAEPCIPQRPTLHPAPIDPRARLVADLLHFATGVPAADILSPDRGSKPVARVRQIAMYLYSTVYAEPALTTAVAFRRERSTALHALARIEDDRDSPAFDAWMDSLEAALLAAPPQGGRA